VSNTKRIASLAFTGAAATGAVAGLAAGPALAAGPTFTVKPGGIYHVANSVTMTFHDLTTNQRITCATSGARATGSVMGGSHLPGESIGTMSGVTFGSRNATCGGPLNTTFIGHASDKWDINAVAEKPGEKGITGTITNVAFFLSGVNNSCDFVVQGSMPASYTNPASSAAPGHLRVLPKSTLKVEGTNSKCGGVIKAGDTATLSTTYTTLGLGPPTITSP
jgi:hypothetical protein